MTKTYGKIVKVSNVCGNVCSTGRHVAVIMQLSSVSILLTKGKLDTGLKHNFDCNVRKPQHTG